MATSNNAAYEFEYAGQHYKWDRNTLRSPQGRAEIQRVLTARIREIGYSKELNAQVEIAEGILRTLAGNPGERELAAIEQQVAEAMTAQENEMASETTTTSPDIERIREMNAIAQSREGAEARQRAATGQSLTPAQAALVKRYNDLEFAHNAQARHEQASPGGWMKTTRPPRIPRELFDLERIQDPREKTFAIRELRSRWRDDKASPFNDVNHPEHHNHVQAMQRLYQAEADLGPQPEDPE